MLHELSLGILDYLDAHLYEEINIDALSLFFGYDKTYFMKRFKADVGISIKTYINQKKIVHSLSLLKDDAFLLSVALRSGYHSLEYYSEVFRRIMGVSPSVFRKYLEGTCSMEELQIIKTSLEAIDFFDKNLASKRSYTELRVPRLVLNRKEEKCA